MTKPAVCLELGCTRAVVARGYCSRHYGRMRKAGAFTVDRRRTACPPEAVERAERFLAYAEVEHWEALSDRRKERFGMLLEALGRDAAFIVWRQAVEATDGRAVS